MTIHDWLARLPRYHLHFTPTSASWLNQVERWFAEITRQQIRRGTHRSTQALETAIKEYLAVYNEDPKPFVWTKTPEQILESLERYCSRISDVGAGDTAGEAERRPAESEKAKLPGRTARNRGVVNDYSTTVSVTAQTGQPASGWR